jgi:endonuclease/exonuclease/phosphatase family metal-dependent hydrolase
VNYEFEEFTSVTLLEYCLASKGFLYCKINSPLFDNPLNIINIHTTSGGLYFMPNSDFVDLLRNNEIDHVLHFVKENNLEENVFLVGDFNFDKNSRGRTTYEYLLKNNYYDMFIDRCMNEKISDTSNNNPNNYTWENTNYLNSTNVHKNELSGRLDYVFVSHKDVFFKKWSLYNSYITFSDPDVFINNELSITKSDHYALICEFSKYI